MTGITSDQDALLERLVTASTDREISVVAFFEGMPNGYAVTKARRDGGILEFETVDDRLVRIRGDTIIAIIEELL